MLIFLVLSALALAAVVLGGIILIPLLAVGAFLWFVLLPIRLLFKLVFGLGGALLGLLLAPIVLLVIAVSLIGAAVTAVFSLAVPLVPVILLACLAWGLYRIAVPRPV